MSWVHPLTGAGAGPIEVVGGKAYGLALLHRLGFSVPPGFVIGAGACLRDGQLPRGLAGEIADAVAGLEAATGRVLGGSRRPLAVSVRSGARESMPGMMDTVLDLGLTEAATAALAAETGDPRFAADSRRRLLAGFVAATGREPPEDAAEQLRLAVAAVFASWDSPRARTYRVLHDIPDDLGTAVIVQAMVFGNRDEHSGSGVAFSRDPTTGAPGPYGEVVFGRQGDDVVSGRAVTHPLGDLAGRAPEVWAGLGAALARIEEHYRDACYVEFTFEAGRLWLLQTRPGRFTGAAAVRLATDLAGQDLIDRGTALLRVSPAQLGPVHRLAATDPADVLARGIPAGPGVAAGRVVTSTERAVRLAAAGPVVLLRPETSPRDLPGLAAAAGVVTARGGPASHAAVVARSMGKPAVVGVTGLAFDGTGARLGGRALAEGTVIAVDGSSGEVVLGSPAVVTPGADPYLRRLLAWADEASGDSSARPDAVRLAAAHAALRR